MLSKELSDLNLFEEEGFIYDEGETPHSEIYGIEIESHYNATPAQVRTSVELYDIVADNRTDVYVWFIELLDNRCQYLDKVEDDQGMNLEFITKPSSARACKTIFRELSEELKFLKSQGFYTEDDDCGFHININPLNWGITWEERENTVRKFMNFCLLNNEFVVKLSGRKKFFQKYVDFTHILGDYLGKNTQQELFTTFNNQLEFCLTNWKNNDVTYFLNVKFNKGGAFSPYIVEIKWFKSTDDAITMCIYLEFVRSLIKFCRQREISDLTFDNYVFYLENNRLIYYLLLDYISKI